MVASIMTHLVREEEEVVLHNQVVTKVMPVPRVVVDLGFQDPACKVIWQKQLKVR